MEQKINDEALLRRYLLGELEGDASVKLEERLFLEDDFFYELLAAEDELVDDYVRGGLSSTEVERFEKHFLLTPERQAKLRFAKSLRRYGSTAAALDKEEASSTERPRPASFWTSILAAFRLPSPALTISAAALLLAFIIVAAWGLLGRRGPETSEDRIVRQSEPAASNRRPEPTQPPAQNTRAEAPADANVKGQTAQAANTNAVKNDRGSTGADDSKAPTVASVILTPGALRGSGETQRLPVPAGKRDRVSLSLELSGDDYRSYSAEILTAEGETVAVRDRLKASRAGAGLRLTLNLPARLFAAGDYQIRLRGENESGQTEDVGRYYFRALKK